MDWVESRNSYTDTELRKKERKDRHTTPTQYPSTQFPFTTLFPSDAEPIQSLDRSWYAKQDKH